MRRKDVSQRIGGNPQEQRFEKGSEATTEIQDEQDEGGKEDENSAEGTKERS